MSKINIAIFSTLLFLVTACSKDDGRELLPDNSISFMYASDKDTLEMPLSILKDTALTFTFKAAISNRTAGTEHYVSFAIDTTKITEYRSRFGDALLLPANSWLFLKQMVRIAPGESVSEDAKLNIGQQLKLREYTTYVLPVVIHSVDGNVDGAGSSRVLYLVLKTGKPLLISKDGWTIAGRSSQYASFAAERVIDADNAGTYWASDIALTLPQWIAINFNRDITFTAVNYYIPPLLAYPTNGGYPTSIQIETSMDNSTWTDHGVFAGNIVNNMQTLELGLTTARHLRFTILAGVNYASIYQAVFISDISLVP